MDNNEKETKFQRVKSTIQSNYWNIVILVGLCTLVIVLLWNWSDTLGIIGKFVGIMSPFLIGIFLAYLIMPLVGLFEKLWNKLFFKNRGKKANRIISITLSYIIVLSIITVFMIFIIPEIAKSIREMNFPKMYNSAIGYYEELQCKFSFLKDVHLEDKLKDLEGSLLDYSSNIAQYIFPKIFNFSKSVVSGTINVVLSIVISCYIVVDHRNLVNNLKRLVFAFRTKEKAQGTWAKLRECNHIFNGFLIGKTIDSLIIGILCFIIMTIFQMPFALLISLIVGITNMIPYFGPFIGAVPGVIIYLLISPKIAIIFAIMILALQQFDGLYLGPKILGDLTGIKPLWVIFAITVGGAYFGVLGMFLGVPVVAVISYLLNGAIEKRLKKKEIKKL